MPFYLVKRVFYVLYRPILTTEFCDNIIEIFAGI